MRVNAAGACDCSALMRSTPMVCARFVVLCSILHLFAATPLQRTSPPCITVSLEPKNPRTLDPEEADFFYVPLYSSCWFHPVAGGQAPERVQLSDRGCLLVPSQTLHESFQVMENQEYVHACIAFINHAQSPDSQTRMGRLPLVVRGHLVPRQARRCDDK